jgi:hypothetical protein
MRDNQHNIFSTVDMHKLDKNDCVCLYILSVINIFSWCRYSQRTQQRSSRRWYVWERTTWSTWKRWVVLRYLPLLLYSSNHGRVSTIILKYLHFPLPRFIALTMNLNSASSSTNQARISQRNSLKHTLEDISSESTLPIEVKDDSCRFPKRG